MLDLLYAQAARWRRRSAERHPDRRRRLGRPVISVGNLSVGGTGKTPVVAALARWLIAQGERPAVLSRGYKRRDPRPGVVVVSDGADVRANLARAGDEPLMLARGVPGAIVCVAEDRHLAGTLAERALGATVHVLDDGFQHLGLARDLDILVTTRGEIPMGRVLPRGRLREPAEAATRADVLVVMGASAAEAAAEARVVGVAAACGATRVLGSPSSVQALEPPSPQALKPPSPFLTAGIAKPERFADDVRAAGWAVAGTAWFPDHHRFTAADVARIAADASACGADAVFTTEKDAVRFEPLGALPFPLYSLPVTVTFDPSSLLFDLVTSHIGADPTGGHA